MDDIKRDETNVRQKHLRSLPLFSSLAPTLVRKLSQSSREIFCHRGQQVFGQGDQIENIYVVLDGQFEIVQKIENQIKMRRHAEIQKKQAIVKLKGNLNKQNVDNGSQKDLQDKMRQNSDRK